MSRAAAGAKAAASKAFVRWPQWQRFWGRGYPTLQWLGQLYQPCPPTPEHHLPDLNHVMLLPLLGACAVVGPFQGPEWEPVRGLLSEDRSCRDPRCCGNLLVLCLFLIWQVRHYWHQVTRTHRSMRKFIKVRGSHSPLSLHTMIVSVICYRDPVLCPVYRRWIQTELWWTQEEHFLASKKSIFLPQSQQSAWTSLSLMPHVQSTFKSYGLYLQTISQIWSFLKPSPYSLGL